MSIMYAAISNFDVVVSHCKKRARRYAKRLRFSCQDTYYIPIKVVENAEAFHLEFGCSNMHLLHPNSSEVEVWSAEKGKWFLRRTFAR